MCVSFLCLVWVWFSRVSEVVHDPSLLVSSFLPMPSQFAATCEQMARQVVVAVAPVMQCEAISQYARSDADSVFLEFGMITAVSEQTADDVWILLSTG